ncbi:hypothetical protein BH23GEM11_BH23GEM11_03830 [soil metagenome]
MQRSRILSACLLAPLVVLAVSACGVDEDASAPSEAPAPAETQAIPEADASLVGELVDVVLANGNVTMGVAVLLMQPHGSTQLGYFRGPRPLAEAASEGSWTFRTEALPARVQRLGPDESLRRRDG